MGVFNKKQDAGGFMDQIRCDEPSYLIWKWHPEGSQLGNNNRENAIRWGSSLRVKDGEVAVFVYKQNEETMEDFIVGPFDEMIKTKNFPVLAKIVGLAYEGGTPFQAEVYFINLAQIIQVQFGVPFFDVYDPRYYDFGVPIAVRGTISFKIEDYKEFVKLHRLIDFSLEDFQRQIKDSVIRHVKDVVTNIPAQDNIPVIQIETKTSVINDKIESSIKKKVANDFGVVVSRVDIGAIEIDKSSEGYKQLMSVTKDVTTATVEAQKEARVKDIAAKQRIEAEHYEESLRIQREEGQYAQHKQTQSANMGAFQVEKQAEVGVAGAEALGEMGANGAGNIDLDGNGGNGSGFNPAAMMAGMAIGGAVGQNVAGTMNGMMQGINENQQASGGQDNMTPPPVIPNGYHIAVNGQTTGPFDMNTLSQMALNGQFGKDTLVWKQGMKDWVKAETVEELQPILNLNNPGNVPPTPPSGE